MNLLEKISFFDPRNIPLNQLNVNLVVGLVHDEETNEFIVQYKDGTEKRLPTINPPAVGDIDAAEIDQDQNLVLVLTNGQRYVVGRIANANQYSDLTPLGTGLLVDGSTNKFKEIVPQSAGLTLEKSSSGAALKLVGGSGTSSLVAGDFDPQKMCMWEVVGDATDTERFYLDPTGWTDAGWNNLPIANALVNNLGVAVSDSVISVSAGQYFIELNTLIRNAAEFIIELYSPSLDQVLLVGDTARYNAAQDTSVTPVALRGEFTLPVDATLVVRFKYVSTQPNFLFGYSLVSSGATAHKAAQITLWKVATVADAITSYPVNDEMLVGIGPEIKTLLETDVTMSLSDIVVTNIQSKTDAEPYFGSGVTAENGIGYLFPNRGEDVHAFDFATGEMVPLKHSGLSSLIKKLGTPSVSIDGTIVVPAPESGEIYTVIPDDGVFERNELKVTGQVDAMANATASLFAGGSGNVNSVIDGDPQTYYSDPRFVLNNTDLWDYALVVNATSSSTPSATVTAFPATSNPNLLFESTKPRENIGWSVSSTDAGPNELYVEIELDREVLVSGLRVGNYLPSAGTDSHAPAEIIIQRYDETGSTWVEHHRISGHPSDVGALVDYKLPMFSARKVRIVIEDDGASVTQYNLGSLQLFAARAYDGIGKAIPALVSADTGNYLPFASEERSGYEAYKAFDPDSSAGEKCWLANVVPTAENPVYIGIKSLTHAMLITGLTISNRTAFVSSIGGVKSYNVQGRNRITGEWDTISTQTGVGSNTRAASHTVDLSAQTVVYSELRLEITEVHEPANGLVAIGYLELQTSTTDSYWNNQYKKAVLQMNANVSAGQTAFASSERTVNFPAYKVFDYSKADGPYTSWVSIHAPTPAAPQYIGVKFVEPKLITAYRIYNRNYTTSPAECQAPKTWTIQYQAVVDGPWLTAHTVANSTNNVNGGHTVWVLDYPIMAVAARIHITAANGGYDWVSMSELEFMEYVPPGTRFPQITVDSNYGDLLAEMVLSKTGGGILSANVQVSPDGSAWEAGKLVDAGDHYVVSADAVDTNFRAVRFSSLVNNDYEEISLGNLTATVGMNIALDWDMLSQTSNAPGSTQVGLTGPNAAAGNLMDTLISSGAYLSESTSGYIELTLRKPEILTGVLIKSTGANALTGVELYGVTDGDAEELVGSSQSNVPYVWVHDAAAATPYKKYRVKPTQGITWDDLTDSGSFSIESIRFSTKDRIDPQYPYGIFVQWGVTPPAEAGNFTSCVATPLGSGNVYFFGDGTVPYVANEPEGWTALDLPADTAVGMASFNVRDAAIYAPGLNGKHSVISVDATFIVDAVGGPLAPNAFTGSVGMPNGNVMMVPGNALNPNIINAAYGFVYETSWAKDTPLQWMDGSYGADGKFYGVNGNGELAVVDFINESVTALSTPDNTGNVVLTDDAGAVYIVDSGATPKVSKLTPSTPASDMLVGAKTKRHWMAY